VRAFGCFALCGCFFGLTSEIEARLHSYHSGTFTMDDRLTIEAPASWCEGPPNLELAGVTIPWVGTHKGGVGVSMVRVANAGDSHINHQ